MTGKIDHILVFTQFKLNSRHTNSPRQNIRVEFSVCSFSAYICLACKCKNIVAQNMTSIQEISGLFRDGWGDCGALLPKITLLGSLSEAARSPVLGFRCWSKGGSV